MRLGRITRLRGRDASGCRFYALQGSYLHARERLPGPHQPVLEIITRRYPSVVAAEDVVAIAARAGRNPQRMSFGRITGACYQTNFYPNDHGNDWACAANKRRVEVVIHSVDITSTFNTASILRAVLRRV